MDYKALGLKIGLELHSQLETHKLFCKCQSILKETKPDFTIKRFLRQILSAKEISIISNQACLYIKPEL